MTETMKYLPCLRAAIALEVMFQDLRAGFSMEKPGEDYATRRAWFFGRTMALGCARDLEPDFIEWEMQRDIRCRERAAREYRMAALRTQRAAAQPVSAA